ncbi:MAG: hypothetical protein M9913_07650 [Bryobacteraceae bacterium]|nr:hypothetical protein [Solibacteraceae bacterium]MCO5350757.1 hypothetical protein [Bryobacteraceae bacterium]
MRMIFVFLALGAVAPSFAQTGAPGAQPCSYFPESQVRQWFPPLASAKLNTTEKGACTHSIVAPTPKHQGVSLNFQSRGVTPKTIDSLFNRMKNGMKTTVKGREVVIAPKDVEWIQGSGDKAFWNNDSQQLAVSAKGHLIYITVNLDAMAKPQKIEAAKKASAAIIAKL